MTRSKTILLTGAARGIGRATAIELASRGHRLAMIDRDAEGLAETLRELPGADSAADVADVSDRQGVGLAVANLVARLGPIEVLVACAGVGRLSNAWDLDTPGLRSMLEVNVLGVAHAIEAVLPGMIDRGSGHLVAISSVAGFRGLPWMPGYSASKAALSTYLEGLRPALKRRGILISNVAPGFVRTGLTVETPFRKPMPMMEPSEAARQIAGVVDRRPRDHVFPIPTALGMGLLRRLPDRVFDWLMDRAGPRALTTEF